METYKDKLLNLINKMVPEVSDIYSGTLTVFQRIRLWDFIENINWVDMCHEISDEAIQRCYKGFIQDISNCIKTEQNSLERVDLESLKRKLLTAPFMNRPRDFITEMAKMVRKEDELIEKYTTDEIPQEQEVTLNDTKDEVMQTLKELTLQIKTKLSESLSAEKQVLDICGVHGPDGQFKMNQMKKNCTRIGEGCRDGLQTFFQNKEKVINFLKKVKKGFQKKMFFDSVNLPMSESAMTLNELDKNFQTLTTCLLSIKEEMERYRDEMAILSEQGRRELQSDLYLHLQEFESQWEDFFRIYLDICVVTVRPPANQYQKTSSTSTKNLEPETTGRTVTESRKNKIENSDLNSTLKILGARSFGLNFKINPMSCLVHFVDERMLPETVLEGTDLKLSSGHIQLCGVLKPDNPPKLGDNAELTFYRTSISNLTRARRNSASPGNSASLGSDDSTPFVCCYFARLCYQISIEVIRRVETLYAVSQPIGLRTGSAQLLPFHGSLTWYAWSVDNVYETLRNPQELPVTKVLNMLDALVSNIQEVAADGSKLKCRPLSDSEKKFLHKKLLGNSVSQTVSLKDFICDKTGDSNSKRKQTSNLSQKTKETTYDFHTWFFALLKSLNGFLKGLWLDHIIYEICSWKEASKVLRRETTPNWRIILRPSESKIRKPKCMKSLLDLILEIKDGHGDYHYINWEARYITHLPKALLEGSIGIQSQDLKILGTNHSYSISTLQDYFSDDETFYYHGTTFKLNLSFEIVSRDQNSSGPEFRAQKKTKAKDKVTADAFASMENSPSINDSPEAMFSQSGWTKSSPISYESVSSYPSPIVPTEVTPHSSLVNSMEQPSSSQVEFMEQPASSQVECMEQPASSQVECMEQPASSQVEFIQYGQEELQLDSISSIDSLSWLIPDHFQNAGQLGDYLQNSHHK